MSTLIEARGLVKHLGGRRVVDGVDLVCHAGQILGLLGPNGAGKTTTLRMLYGFLQPDAGRIHVSGIDLARDLVRAKRSIGVCTQDDTFDGDFTVEQNLTVAASYFRPRPTDLARRVGELLDRFDLRAYARQKPEVPLSADELADFARTFPALRYEVRVPTLDDLFLKLALDP